MIRSYLKYSDVIYVQAYKVSFHRKLESIQYNAALVVSGAIRRTMRNCNMRKTLSRVSF